MRNLKYLIIALVFIGCGNTNNNNTEKDVIDRAVEENQQVTFILDSALRHSDDFNLNFLYHDSIFWGYPFSMTDSFQLTLKNTQDLYLIYANKEQMPLLVNAGDTIFARYSAHDKSLIFENSHPHRNSFMSFVQSVVKHHGALFPFILDSPIQQQKVSTLKKMKEREAYIHDLKMKRLSHLDTYVKTHPMDLNVKNRCIEIIDFGALNDSIMLYQNNKSLLHQDRSLALRIDQLVQRLNSLTFEANYPYFKVFNNLAGLISAIEIVKSRSEYDKVIHFVTDNIQGDARDFLIARYAYLAATTSFFAEASRYQSHLSDHSSYRRYLDSKLSDLKRKQELKTQERILNAATQEQTILQDILLNDKGKVILIDFWASWCQPCIAEFPYSQQLKNLFSGDDLKIIYFSIDQDIQSWKMQ